MYAYYDPSYVEGSPSYAGDDGFVDVPLVYVANDGWDLLNAGDAREARRSFDTAVNAYPNDGLPLIGYAISGALLERYDEAIDSMRKAMRLDPQSLNEVPRTAEMMNAVGTALAHYEAMLQQAPRDVNTLFMVAALRYLNGNEAMAFFAADQAIDAGDKDLSTVYLKGTIRHALDNAPAAPAQPSAPPATSIFEQGGPDLPTTAPASQPEPLPKEEPSDTLF